MVDEVVLITGIDIPFPPAEITIHQPTIEEIAYIGEDAFFNGIHMLQFNKDMLSLENMAPLEQLSDFSLSKTCINNNTYNITDAIATK